jgi:orotidine-5'-phosphate decarboxylase
VVPLAPQSARDRDGASNLDGTVPAVGFGERLAARVAERGSQIVLGIDPDPSALWPAAARLGHAMGDDTPPAVRAAAAVRAHCEALIDAAGPACVAVKPQLARFELLGAPGREALGAVCAHAREAGLLVIADAKRGDIDVSAKAYAQALFAGSETPYGAVEGLRVDMATINPLMGSDALAPFIVCARESGAGVLVLVRTSNPGAADIEDLTLAAGGRVWERIAALVGTLGGEGASEGGNEGAGDKAGESGLGDVGAVVGATVPQHLARARELMPRAVFLLPGVGAQGGRVEDLAPEFAPGRAGGLISASRSIAGAHLTGGGEPASAARAEAERLRELAWALSA